MLNLLKCWLLLLFSTFSTQQNRSGSGMGDVAVDMELVGQSPEAIIDRNEANPGTEVVDGSRGLVDVEAAAPMDTGAVATEEQLEAGQKGLKIMEKFTFGSCVSLSIPLIIASTSKTYNSGRTHGKPILYKMSDCFAFISFCAGVGLLVTSHYKWVGKSTRLGLIYVALISLIVAVLIFAMNAAI